MLTREVEVLFMSLTSQLRREGFKGTLILIPESQEEEVLCSIDGTEIPKELSTRDVATITVNAHRKRC